jgi:hypothetical protein
MDTSKINYEKMVIRAIAVASQPIFPILGKI